MSSVVIAGEVLSTTGKGVADAVVEIIAAATSRLVVAERTDERGRFSISIAAAAFERLRAGGQLRFRAFDGEKLAADDVRPWSPAERRIYLVASAVKPAHASSHVVYGSIGERAAVTVRVAMLDGKKPVTLAETKPAADGTYEVTFARTQLHGVLRPDLVVTAYDQSGREVGRSAVHRRAIATVEIDLELATDAFERARKAMGTVKKVGELARAARITPTEARRAIVASRVATAIDVDPRSLFVLAEHGLPASERALLSRRPSEILDAIASARAAGALDLDDGAATKLAANIERAAIARALREPGRSRSAPFFAAVAASGLAPAVQQRIVAAERAGGDVRRAIAEDAQLDGAARERAVLCLDVASLVDHPPVTVRAIGTRTNVRELATLELADWVALVGSDAPADVEPRAYAERLYRRVERELPGAFFARRLERTAAAGVIRVLDREDFVLGTTPVAAFVAAHRDLLGDGDEALHAATQLRIIDRLHRITPRFDDVRPLLGRYDSAGAIARTSKQSFVRRNGHAMSDDRAGAVYESATKANDAALGLAAGLHPSLSITDIVAIDGIDPPEIATWTTLFGSADFCACDHCRSVLGPAAYFVDLLEYLARHDGIGAKLAIGGSQWARRSLVTGGESTTRIRLDDALANAPANLVDDIVHRNLSAGDLLKPDDELAGIRDDLQIAPDWTFEQTDPWGTAIIEPQTARDVLLRRRGDLSRIALSCANTNTVVPQIDLANELLEVEVVRDAGDTVQWPTRIETKGEAEDLAIEPEPGPGKLAAEELLAKARFPFTAPYEAWSEETRALLAHLGVPLHELMAALSRWAPGELVIPPTVPIGPVGPVVGPIGPVGPVEPGPIGPVVAGEPVVDVAYARACAQLGLAHVERGFFEGGTGSAAITSTLWGFASATANVRDPASPGDRISGPWRTVLSRVSVMLARTGLELDELEIALAGRALPDPRPRIEPIAGASKTTCKTSELEVADFTDAHARRLYALLRLRRALGWTIAEVDKVVDGLGSAINARTVIALARIDRIRRRFRRPVLEIAAWWTPIDTYSNSAEDKPSHYRAVFLAPSVANPPPAGLSPTALSGTLADHAGPICAALSLTALDLEALQAAFPELAGALTIDKLSLVFRYASLARMLRTRVVDVLALVELSGIEPFARNALDAAERFLDLGATFVRLRLSGDDLAYLLRHDRLDRAPIVLQPEQATATITAAELAVRSVDEALAPQRDALEAVDPAAPIVTGDAALRDVLVTPTRELLATVIDLVLVEPALRWIAAGPGEATDAAVQAALAQLPGLEDVGDRLAGANPIAGSTARLAYVLAALLFHVRSVRASRAIVETLAGAVRLDADLAGRLLGTHLRSSVDPARFAITDFLSDAPAAARLATHERLYKAAILLGRAGITSADLVHVLAPPAGAGWLALDRLPVAPAAADPALLRGVLGLVELATARRNFPGGAPALREVLDLALASEGDVVPKPTREDVLAALEERTDWPVADVERLADRLDITLPAALRDPSALDRLARAATVVRRLGVAAATAIEWVTLPSTPAAGRAIAAAVRNAAIARHGRETWRSSARPLVDQLRERRRDALVAHLVHALDLADANALHGHLLVDTQVNACAMTSRIRFAIASVQLFVQRCFLGLERGITLSDEASREWEWMKAYRVWEANRKVFLWPENWLYPELRADKSQLFEALETEVASGGLDGASAEAALRRYVEGLAEISRLEIVGSYRHVKSTGDVFHVIGKSSTSPPRYYHCERVEDVWSPWRRIEVDISGPHCFPVVVNGCLHVFWSQIEAVQDIVAELGSDQSAAKDDLDIRICWSMKQTDGWGPVRRSPPLRMPIGNAFNSARDFIDAVFFVTRIVGGRLVIRCAAMPKSSIHSLADGCVRIGDFEIAIAGDLATIARKLPHVVESSLDEEDSPLRGYMEAPSEKWLARFAPFTDTHYRYDHIVTENKLKLLGGTYVPDPMLPEGLDTVAIAGEDGATRDEIEERMAGTTATTIFNLAAEYRVLVPHQYEQYVSQDLAFVWDAIRTVMVTPAPAGVRIRTGPYKLTLFEHPLAREMLDRLTRVGPAGIYDWGWFPIQRLEREAFANHAPVNVGPVPKARIELRTSMPYAVYNWELFLHVPLLVADRLTKNRRFEEARRWLHAVFDPTAGGTLEAPKRFWNFAPFRDSTIPPSIEQLLEELAGGDTSLVAEIERWRANPFEPHRIAASRRSAYQKNVVMRYIDTLIAWADDLFRRDTGEAVDEATLLYLLAAEILGPRPRRVNRQTTADRTYAELAPALDEFSNALVELESVVWPQFELHGPAQFEGDRILISNDAAIGIDGPTHVDGAIRDRPDFHFEQRTPGIAWNPAPPPRVLYFGIPPNEKLLERWDIVADRLFKIRCCMNLDGVRRDLPLFEPPIDPELLVRARAAGLDLDRILASLDAPLPRVRFSRLLQLAKELVADVRTLGASILAAREKRDGEALERLRSTHELALLDATREIRQQRVQEEREELAVLRTTRTSADHRARNYRARETLNALERRQSEEAASADNLTGMAQQAMLLASSYTGAYTWAGAIAGLASGSVTSVDLYDPKMLNMIGESTSLAFELEATRARANADALGTLAGYQRRQADWDLEAELAELEVATIDRRIIAAEIRVAAAEYELASHDRQRENARELDEHLRDKFTGVALYEWMSAQLGAVYFQAYELAAETARKAERAFQFELGRPDARFVEPTHWDSLHQGLLAGERLGRDLQRMEAAHLDLRHRELELRRHIALSIHAPASLVELKTRGSCVVVLPEALFDADFPGHYFRRLRRVELAIPCVVGAYGTVNCTLTLLDDAIRVEPRYGDGDDDPTRRSGAPIESIVTSSGIGDGGTLQLAPPDQLLPFEGSGAVSRWRIDLPADTNDFDLSELTDVVFRLDYTARDGGDPFRAEARARLDELRSRLDLEPGSLAPRRMQRLFSLKHEMPMQWRAFLSGAATELPLSRDRFPFLLRGRDLAIDRATIAWLPKRSLEPEDAPPAPLDLVLTPPAPSTSVTVENLGPSVTAEAVFAGVAVPGAWRLAAPRAFDPQRLDDILIAVSYTVGQ